MGKQERKVARDGILANLQFFIDEKSEELFEGITMNLSSSGFGFLTETSVKKGQTITITKEMSKKGATPKLTGKRGKVIWVKKRSHYLEAGVEFDPDD